jgi:hypothetical protein
MGLLQLRDLMNQRYTAELVPFIGNPWQPDISRGSVAGLRGKILHLLTFPQRNDVESRDGREQTYWRQRQKGTVKKRSQTRTTIGGASGWTKRNKKFGEFMAVKKPAKKTKAATTFKGVRVEKKAKSGDEKGRAVLILFSLGSVTVVILLRCRFRRDRYSARAARGCLT